MRKGILVCALVEFRSHQVETAIRMAEKYSDSSSCGDCWRVICNCVDLWRGADEALAEIQSIKETTSVSVEV